MFGLVLLANFIFLHVHSSPILKNPTDTTPLYRPTWIEVNLDTVHRNVRLLKLHITERVHLMAVVKANAYGYGMLEIARTALSANATWLGVATLNEALVLRRQLSKTVPILVMGYIPPPYLSVASESDITVSVISLEWMQEAARLVRRPLDIHLKLDTGMNRLGCRTEEEVREVLALVASNRNLRLRGIFTHFATSEDMTNTTYFRRQLARFNELLQIIPNRTEKLIHCANSGGTLYHANDTFFDMVRCGKALTGPPNEPLKDRLPVDLQSAISLYSAFSHVKRVAAGEKIGYGDFYTTPEEQWIGTVPIGYGDGWHQGYKTTRVLVDGKRMEIVGRISMDQLTVVLDQSYPVGTRVTFVGQQGNETITGDEIAMAAGLPRSEVFSSLSDRVTRLFTLSNRTIINAANSLSATLHLLLVAVFLFLLA